MEFSSETRKAMKQRGKTVEVFNKDLLEFNFSAASEIPCKKHPNSSSVGICPNCLKERLLKLVCTECGEQRFSSCSCSDDVSSSSYRNSCSAMEIGSVGRVSFLIENHKNESNFVLRRSSSSSVELSKNRGFSRIKSLFRRKGMEKDGELSDQRSEFWVSDNPMSVSRSRSFCSYRGDDYNGFSSRKISDVTTNQFMFLLPDESSEPRRKSGFRGLFGGKMDGARNSMDLDESGFIDLKFDLLSNTKQGGSSDDHGLLSKGNEVRGLKRDSRRPKAWKWIFKYHSANKEEKERRRRSEIQY